MKEPWKVEGNPWNTESKFITWVRGVLRKGWSKHPLKLEYIKRFRKRIKNPNPKGKSDTVWGMTCEMCGKDTVQSQIEIDHKGEQGKFTTLSEIEAYARHLFYITYESIRAVCKPCHKIISMSQRNGSSFEQAATDKEIIRLLKKENKQELENLLTQNNFVCKNNAQRKEALKQIYKTIKED